MAYESGKLQLDKHVPYCCPLGLIIFSSSSCHLITSAVTAFTISVTDKTRASGAYEGEACEDDYIDIALEKETERETQLIDTARHDFWHLHASLRDC
jgi:hypothetical protein